MNRHATASKPPSPFLLALCMSLGMLLTFPVQADENLFDSLGLSRWVDRDGDLQLAPVGKNGVLQVSLQSPSQENHALYSSQVAGAVNLDPGVHLSVKLPW
jgi:hypothetical protein